MRTIKIKSELDRLYALIKRAEWTAVGSGIRICPWCGTIRIDGDGPGHSESCPAFSRDGGIRRAVWLDAEGSEYVLVQVPRVIRTEDADNHVIRAVTSSREKAEEMRKKLIAWLEEQ